MAEISLRDVAKYYNNQDHQNFALDFLQDHIPEGILAKFSDLWRSGPKNTIANNGHGICLNVPYEYQLDNESGTGWRECFSSSCAMVARFYKKVKNDDEYNRIRRRFGDSTSAQAQLDALEYLGLRAKFVQNGTPELLRGELDAGRPVVVGWLHKGLVGAPSGGGHYSVVIGYIPGAWIHHDPNGEADMVRGGYTNHSGGKAVVYSQKNWNKRWEVEGPGSGWAILIENPS